jgi:hypothetical protein
MACPYVIIDSYPCLEKIGTLVLVWNSGMKDLNGLLLSRDQVMLLKKSLIPDEV